MPKSASDSSNKKSDNILGRDVGEILKSKYHLSVLSLLLLTVALFVTAFFAGTQTAGVFQLFPKALTFRTQQESTSYQASGTSCNNPTCKEGYTPIGCGGPDPSGKYNWTCVSSGPEQNLSPVKITCDVCNSAQQCVQKYIVSALSGETCISLGHYDPGTQCGGTNCGSPPGNLVGGDPCDGCFTSVEGRVDVHCEAASCNYKACDLCNGYLPNVASGACGPVPRGFTCPNNGEPVCSPSGSWGCPNQGTCSDWCTQHPNSACESGDCNKNCPSLCDPSGCYQKDKPTSQQCPGGSKCEAGVWFCIAAPAGGSCQNYGSATSCATNCSGKCSGSLCCPVGVAPPASPNGATGGCTQWTAKTGDCGTDPNRCPGSTNGGLNWCACMQKYNGYDNSKCGDAATGLPSSPANSGETTGGKTNPNGTPVPGQPGGLCGGGGNGGCDPKSNTHCGVDPSNNQGLTCIPNTKEKAPTECTASCAQSRSTCLSGGGNPQGHKDCPDGQVCCG